MGAEDTPDSERATFVVAEDAADIGISMVDEKEEVKATYTGLTSAL